MPIDQGLLQQLNNILQKKIEISEEIKGEEPLYKILSQFKSNELIAANQNQQQNQQQQQMQEQVISHQEQQHQQKKQHDIQDQTKQLKNYYPEIKPKKEKILFTFKSNANINSFEDINYVGYGLQSLEKYPIEGPLYKREQSLDCKVYYEYSLPGGKEPPISITLEESNNQIKIQDKGITVTAEQTDRINANLQQNSQFLTDDAYAKEKQKQTVSTVKDHRSRYKDGIKEMCCKLENIATNSNPKLAITYAAGETLMSLRNDAHNSMTTTTSDGRASNAFHDYGMNIKAELVENPEWDSAISAWKCKYRTESGYYEIETTYYTTASKDCQNSYTATILNHPSMQQPCSQVEVKPCKGKPPSDTIYVEIKNPCKLGLEAIVKSSFLNLCNKINPYGYGSSVIERVEEKRSFFYAHEKEILDYAGISRNKLIFKADEKFTQKHPIFTSNENLENIKKIIQKQIYDFIPYTAKFDRKNEKIINVSLDQECIQLLAQKGQTPTSLEMYVVHSSDNGEEINIILGARQEPNKKQEQEQLHNAFTLSNLDEVLKAVENNKSEFDKIGSFVKLLGKFKLIEKFPNQVCTVKSLAKLHDFMLKYNLLNNSENGLDETAWKNSWAKFLIEKLPENNNSNLFAVIDQIEEFINILQLSLEHYSFYYPEYSSETIPPTSLACFAGKTAPNTEEIIRYMKPAILNMAIYHVNYEDKEIPGKINWVTAIKQYSWAEIKLYASPLFSNTETKDEQKRGLYNPNEFNFIPIAWPLKPNDTSEGSILAYMQENIVTNTFKNTLNALTSGTLCGFKLPTIMTACMNFNFTNLANEMHIDALRKYLTNNIAPDKYTTLKKIEDIYAKYKEILEDFIKKFKAICQDYQLDYKAFISSFSLHHILIAEIIATGVEFDMQKRIALIEKYYKLAINKLNKDAVLYAANWLIASSHMCINSETNALEAFARTHYYTERALNLRKSGNLNQLDQEISNIEKKLTEAKNKENTYVNEESHETLKNRLDSLKKERQLLQNMTLLIDATKYFPIYRPDEFNIIENRELFSSTPFGQQLEMAYDVNKSLNNTYINYNRALIYSLSQSDTQNIVQYLQKNTQNNNVAFKQIINPVSCYLANQFNLKKISVETELKDALNQQYKAQRVNIIQQIADLETSIDEKKQNKQKVESQTIEQMQNIEKICIFKNTIKNLLYKEEELVKENDEILPALIQSDIYNQVSKFAERIINDAIVGNTANESIEIIQNNSSRFLKELNTLSTRIAALNASIKFDEDNQQLVECNLELKNKKDSYANAIAAFYQKISTIIMEKSDHLDEIIEKLNAFILCIVNTQDQPKRIKLISQFNSLGTQECISFILKCALVPTMLYTYLENDNPDFRKMLISRDDFESVILNILANFIQKDIYTKLSQQLPVISKTLPKSIKAKYQPLEMLSLLIKILENGYFDNNDGKIDSQKYKNFLDNIEQTRIEETIYDLIYLDKSLFQAKYLSQNKEVQQQSKHCLYDEIALYALLGNTHYYIKDPNGNIKQIEPKQLFDLIDAYYSFANKNIIELKKMQEQLVNANDAQMLGYISSLIYLCNNQKPRLNQLIASLNAILNHSADLFTCMKTGEGKTLVFTLAMLADYKKNNQGNSKQTLYTSLNENLLMQLLPVIEKTAAILGISTAIIDNDNRNDKFGSTNIVLTTPPVATFIKQAQDIENKTKSNPNTISYNKIYIDEFSDQKYELCVTASNILPIMSIEKESSRVMLLKAMLNMASIEYCKLLDEYKIRECTTAGEEKELATKIEEQLNAKLTSWMHRISNIKPINELKRALEEYTYVSNLECNEENKLSNSGSRLKLLNELLGDMKQSGLFKADNITYWLLDSEISSEMLQNRDFVIDPNGQIVPLVKGFPMHHLSIKYYQLASLITRLKLQNINTIPSIPTQISRANVACTGFDTQYSEKHIKTQALSATNPIWLSGCEAKVRIPNNSPVDYSIEYIKTGKKLSKFSLIANNLFEKLERQKTYTALVAVHGWNKEENANDCTTNLKAHTLYNLFVSDNRNLKPNQLVFLYSPHNNTIEMSNTAKTYLSDNNIAFPQSLAELNIILEKINNMNSQAAAENKVKAVLIADDQVISVGNDVKANTTILLQNYSSYFMEQIFSRVRGANRTITIYTNKDNTYDITLKKDLKYRLQKACDRIQELSLITLAKAFNDKNIDENQFYVLYGIFISIITESMEFLSKQPLNVAQEQKDIMAHLLAEAYKKANDISAKLPASLKSVFNTVAKEIFTSIKKDIESDSKLIQNADTPNQETLKMRFIAAFYSDKLSEDVPKHLLEKVRQAKIPNLANNSDIQAKKTYILNQEQMDKFNQILKNTHQEDIKNFSKYIQSWLTSTDKQDIFDPQHAKPVIEAGNNAVDWLTTQYCSNIFNQIPTGIGTYAKDGHATELAIKSFFSSKFISEAIQQKQQLTKILLCSEVKEADVIAYLLDFNLRFGTEAWKRLNIRFNNTSRQKYLDLIKASITLIEEESTAENREDTHIFYTFMKVLNSIADARAIDNNQQSSYITYAIVKALIKLYPGLDPNEQEQLQSELELMSKLVSMHKLAKLLQYGAQDGINTIVIAGKKITYSVIWANNSPTINDLIHVAIEKKPDWDLSKLNQYVQNDFICKQATTDGKIDNKFDYHLFQATLFGVLKAYSDLKQRPLTKVVETYKKAISSNDAQAKYNAIASAIILALCGSLTQDFLFPDISKIVAIICANDTQIGSYNKNDENLKDVVKLVITKLQVDTDIVPQRVKCLLKNPGNDNFEENKNYYYTLGDAPEEFNKKATQTANKHNQVVNYVQSDFTKDNILFTLMHNTRDLNTLLNFMQTNIAYLGEILGFCQNATAQEEDAFKDFLKISTSEQISTEINQKLYASYDNLREFKKIPMLADILSSMNQIYIKLKAINLSHKFEELITLLLKEKLDDKIAENVTHAIVSYLAKIELNETKWGNLISNIEICLNVGIAHKDLLTVLSELNKFDEAQLSDRKTNLKPFKRTLATYFKKSLESKQQNLIDPTSCVGRIIAFSKKLDNTIICNFLERINTEELIHQFIEFLGTSTLNNLGEDDIAKIATHCLRSALTPAKLFNAGYYLETICTKNPGKLDVILPLLDLVDEKCQQNAKSIKAYIAETQLDDNWSAGNITKLIEVFADTLATINTPKEIIGFIMLINPLHWDKLKNRLGIFIQNLHHEQLREIYFEYHYFVFMEDIQANPKPDSKAMFSINDALTKFINDDNEAGITLITELYKKASTMDSSSVSNIANLIAQGEIKNQIQLDNLLYAIQSGKINSDGFKTLLDATRAYNGDANFDPVYLNYLPVNEQNMWMQISTDLALLKLGFPELKLESVLALYEQLKKKNATKLKKEQYQQIAQALKLGENSDSKIAPLSSIIINIESPILQEVLQRNGVNFSVAGNILYMCPNLSQDNCNIQSIVIANIKNCLLNKLEYAKAIELIKLSSEGICIDSAIGLNANNPITDLSLLDLQQLIETAGKATGVNSASVIAGKLTSDNETLKKIIAITTEITIGNLEANLEFLAKIQSHYGDYLMTMEKIEIHEELLKFINPLEDTLKLKCLLCVLNFKDNLQDLWQVIVADPEHAKEVISNIGIAECYAFAAFAQAFVKPEVIKHDQQFDKHEEKQEIGELGSEHNENNSALQSGTGSEEHNQSSSEESQDQKQDTQEQKQEADQRNTSNQNIILNEQKLKPNDIYQENLKQAAITILLQKGIIKADQNDKNFIKQQFTLLFVKEFITEYKRRLDAKGCFGISNFPKKPVDLTRINPDAIKNLAYDKAYDILEAMFYHHEHKRSFWRGHNRTYDAATTIINRYPDFFKNLHADKTTNAKLSTLLNCYAPLPQEAPNLEKQKVEQEEQNDVQNGSQTNNNIQNT